MTTKQNRFLLPALFFASLFSSGVAHGAENSATPLTENQKITNAAYDVCSKEFREQNLPSAEYKTFMDPCLKKNGVKNFVWYTPTGQFNGVPMPPPVAPDVPARPLPTREQTYLEVRNICVLKLERQVEQEKLSDARVLAFMDDCYKANGVTVTPPIIIPPASDKGVVEAQPSAVAPTKP